MMDLRLREDTAEVNGRRYVLRCNMAVLAEVQAGAEDGNIMTVLRSGPFVAAPRIFAAMLNDFAAEQGWPERYTPEQAARLLPPHAATPLVGMLSDAMTDGAPEMDENPPEALPRTAASAEESISRGTYPFGSPTSAETRELSGEP